MLVPFINVILILLNLVWWLVVISVVASWLVAFGVINTRNMTVYRILDMLNRVTEPVFRPIRRLIPPMGGLDLSPLVVLLVIYLIQSELAIMISRGYFS
jgi:YggT family protein